MQISLNQDEITEAVTKQVLGMISLKPNQKVTVDFTAGRGSNGLTANIEIASADLKSKPTVVTRSVPVAVETLPEPEPNSEVDDGKAEEKDLPSPEPEPKTEASAPKDIFGKKNTSAEAPEKTDEATPSEESDHSDTEEASAPKSIFSKKKAS